MIAGPIVGNRNALQLHVLLAVEHGREHCVVIARTLSACHNLRNSCGRTMIFSGFSSRELAGMRRQTKRKFDLIKRNPMRNQEMHRQPAAENEVRRILSARSTEAL